MAINVMYATFIKKKKINKVSRNKKKTKKLFSLLKKNTLDSTEKFLIRS